ncbi:hypothetical protein M427DRAFT_50957 [Gonapodya prolifera JEL478]|uniref:N-acetyltransferase domain-containing protein n=1 Tax=Gonapodya prolifera (strain JEL478) TaxID=1344416 RepID=A0A139AYJ3_GONPJ|nr:hypothetical protein M427DRAFT_50957 [Gonapodya prolifera JEL478]|eukprot:KXS21525.1 hypothetical protein M427DRAFT_50957 [Gonapodya prolifera JEL478]
MRVEATVTEGIKSNLRGQGKEGKDIDGEPLDLENKAGKPEPKISNPNQISEDLSVGAVKQKRAAVAEAEGSGKTMESKVIEAGPTKTTRGGRISVTRVSSHRGERGGDVSVTTEHSPRAVQSNAKSVLSTTVPQRGVVGAPVSGLAAENPGVANAGVSPSGFPLLTPNHASIVSKNVSAFVQSQGTFGVRPPVNLSQYQSPVGPGTAQGGHAPATSLPLNPAFAALLSSLPTSEARQALLDGFANGSITYQFLHPLSYAITANPAALAQLPTSSAEPSQGGVSGLLNNASLALAPQRVGRPNMLVPGIAPSPVDQSVRGRGTGRPVRGKSSRGRGASSMPTTTTPGTSTLDPSAAEINDKSERPKKRKRDVETVTPVPQSQTMSSNDLLTNNPQSTLLEEKRELQITLKESDEQLREQKRQRHTSEAISTVGLVSNSSVKAQVNLPTVIEYSEASGSESEDDMPEEIRTSTHATKAHMDGGNASFGESRRLHGAQSKSSNRVIESQGRKESPNADPSPRATLKHRVFGNPRHAPVAKISPWTGRLLKPFIFRDAETVSPYVQLLEDIISKGGGRVSERKPIDFIYLEKKWVVQCNWLLCNMFWNGIDISEHLKYPDFSVVCVYDNIVVGCGLMTPQGYITYIGVLPGWEKCGIGRIMLWWLIQTVKPQDVTLHVQTKNSAMILYQEFGFKAEEFIVGFYNKYLPGSNFTGENNAYVMRRRGSPDD